MPAACGAALVEAMSEMGLCAANTWGERRPTHVPWRCAAAALEGGSAGSVLDYALLPIARLDRAPVEVMSMPKGFSRKLLLGLHVSALDRSALLCPEAALHRTEHSDRCGLDSWADMVGMPEWKRDFREHWSTNSSVNKCVRTASKIIEEG